MNEGRERNEKNEPHSGRETVKGGVLLSNLQKNNEGKGKQCNSHSQNPFFFSRFFSSSSFRVFFPHEHQIFIATIYLKRTTHEEFHFQKCFVGIVYLFIYLSSSLVSFGSIFFFLCVCRFSHLFFSSAFLLGQFFFFLDILRCFVPFCCVFLYIW